MHTLHLHRVERRPLPNAKGAQKGSRQWCQLLRIHRLCRRIGLRLARQWTSRLQGLHWTRYVYFPNNRVFGRFRRTFCVSDKHISLAGQYFVITDIGNGNYQWYAFLARPPDSASTTEMPDGSSMYLQGVFDGWSSEIHDILKVTQEHEIEQRDLYDRPPSVRKPWTDGPVALLGDGIHGKTHFCRCYLG